MFARTEKLWIDIRICAEQLNLQGHSRLLLGSFRKKQAGLGLQSAVFYTNKRKWMLKKLCNCLTAL